MYLSTKPGNEVAAFLPCFGNSAVRLFFQLKTKAANRMKKKFNSNKNERIMIFQTSVIPLAEPLTVRAFKVTWQSLCML